MILPIYIYGQPVLRKQCEEIDATYPDLPQLISDMFETLTHSNGVGLAAPQIGRAIRLAVIDLDVLKDDLPEYAGFRRAFINPRIVEYDDTQTETTEEGCLSIPGLNENVRRPARIHVNYLDTDFQPHDEWVDGYLAVVMQHEFDHLDGVMFIDRLSPLRKQLIRNKLKAMAHGKYHASYRTKAVHR